MDAETAYSVAWIGVLGGVIGGGSVALIQYLIHRHGSLIQWRSQVREVAADFLWSVTNIPRLARNFGDFAGNLDTMHRNYRRLELLATDSMVQSAQRVQDIAIALAGGSARQQGESKQVDWDSLEKSVDEFVSETRKVLKARD